MRYPTIPCAPKVNKNTEQKLFKCYLDIKLTFISDTFTNKCVAMEGEMSFTSATKSTDEAEEPSSTPSQSTVKFKMKLISTHLGVLSYVLGRCETIFHSSSRCETFYSPKFSVWFTSSV